MTAPTDLIRRDAAFDALARVGILPEDAAMDAIREVPADPVGEAAGKLAEATDAMEDDCCGAGLAQYLAANGWTDSEAAFIRMLSALDAYRAAVAARDAGEPR